MRVSLVSEGMQVLRINGALGKEHRVNIQQQASDILLDVSNLPAGIYLLVDTANSASARFVVQ